MSVTLHDRGNVMAVSVHDIVVGVKFVMEDVAILFVFSAKMLVVNVHPPAKE